MYSLYVFLTGRRAMRPGYVVAQTGDVLESTATGERLVFRRVDADVLEYDLWFRPRGFAAQPHLHPSQDERHTVVEGRLGLEVNGEHRVLEAGDSVVVPARTRHRIAPVDGQQVHALFEIRPALRSAELLERLFSLGEKPGLLALAQVGRDFRAEGYATRPPLAVQKALFDPLA